MAEATKDSPKELIWLRRASIPGLVQDVAGEWYGMSTFDKREKGEEAKFARNEELSFKINARSNKLLGLWQSSPS